MRKINFQLLLGFVFYTTIITGQCWKSVSVGYTHVLAITEDNKLWGWGNNGYGQLGDGTNISKNSPTQINSDTDWKIVSAGSGPVAFTLAIKNDGTLWGWGNNAYGQVGDGTFINKNIPTQIGTENNWKSISAGYSHALAIKEDGTLWSWGDSTLFALGNTTGYGEGFHRNIPAQVGTLSTWVMASAGKEYSLGLRTDARVYGWGRNNANQLGLTNQSTYIINPSSRTGFNSTNTKYTSAGGVHSYDVKNTTDQIVVYGSNVFGQGGGTTCAGCPNYYVKEMDCGDNTSAIIKQDGTLWFTGVKLGYEEPTVQYTSTFLQLGTANNWKSVSVGNQSAAAINMNGEMFTWGWNFWGNLGNGTNGSATNSQSLVSVICPLFLQNEYYNKESFFITPNPAEDYFTLSSLDNSIEEISLTDITGKTVLIVYEGFEKINISSLQKGTYFVKIKQKENFSFVRLLKK